MNVPKGAVGGKIIKYKGTIDEKEYRFEITGARTDKNGRIDIYWLKFNRPCYYATCHYEKGKGELTRRKGGKYMFKKRTRLYSNEEVIFYTI